MNKQDKGIVNSILSYHKKREPRGVKLKNRHGVRGATFMVRIFNQSLLTL